MRYARDEIEQVLCAAVTPTWQEVVRSKEAILRIIQDGAAHGINDLQKCLFEAEHVPASLERQAKVEIADGALESTVTTAHPVIRHHRYAYAATEAIIDLLAQGVLVSVATAPEQSTGHSVVRGDTTIGLQHFGHGWGFRPEWPLPTLDSAYRLAPRFTQPGRLAIVHPDVFCADIEALNLDRQTRRCIEEALASLRGGQYLAAANMLGAASEGAWYAAGEQLRGIDAQLDKALDANNTTKVVARVAERLRNVTRLRSQVRELEAQAALLTDLRDYGIHPRATDTDHLERYFTEPGAAMLLMETHNYLVRLGDAVVARLSDDDA